LVAGLGSVAILLLLRIRHRFGMELRRVIMDEAPARDAPVDSVV